MQTWIYKCLYFCGIARLLYINFTQSNRARTRYERKEMVDEFGRDTSDKGAKTIISRINTLHENKFHTIYLFFELGYILFPT